MSIQIPAGLAMLIGLLVVGPLGGLWYILGGDMAFFESILRALGLIG